MRYGSKNQPNQANRIGQTVTFRTNAPAGPLWYMKPDDHLVLCSRCRNAWGTISVKFSAEGRGVYDEVSICPRCMDSYNQMMIDLKADDIDL